MSQKAFLLRTFSIISFLELLILPSLLIPNLMTLLLLETMETPAMMLVFIILYLLALVIVSAITDQIFSKRRSAATPLPANAIDRIKIRLEELRCNGGPDIPLDRVLVVGGDFSVGAHVRGVFRPNVVISGGMFVGLLRNLGSCSAILAHEMGHIIEFDRLYYSLIALVAFNFAFYYPSIFIQVSLNPWEHHEIINPGLFLFNVLSTTVIIAFISRRRELNADLIGSTLVGVDNYINGISEGMMVHTASAFSFFHPNAGSRVLRLEKLAKRGFVLDLMILLFIIYFFICITGIVNGKINYISAAIGSFIGIVLEIIKTIIMFLSRKSIRSKLVRP